MRTCPVCHLGNTDDARFCCACGEELRQAQPDPSPRKFGLPREQETEVAPGLLVARQGALVTLLVSAGWGLTVLSMALMGGLGYAFSGYEYSSDDVLTYLFVLLISWVPALVAAVALRTSLARIVPPWVILSGMSAAFLAMAVWLGPPSWTAGHRSTLQGCWRRWCSAQAWC